MNQSKIMIELNRQDDRRGSVHGRYPNTGSSVTVKGEEASGKGDSLEGIYRKTTGQTCRNDLRVPEPFRWKRQAPRGAWLCIAEDLIPISAKGHMQNSIPYQLLLSEASRAWLWRD